MLKALIIFNEQLMRTMMRSLILLVPVLFFTVVKPQDRDTLNNEADEFVVDSAKQDASQNDIFYNHVNENEVKPIVSDEQPFWLFLIFMFQLVLVAYLRISFSREMDDMFKGLMSLNIARQLYREQEQSMHISAIFYNINFVLTGGIFLFLLNRNLGWMKDDTLISMLFFLWAVIVVYSFRFGIMKFVSLIFPFGNVVDHYSFNFFLVQKTMGLVLVPFNLMIAYAPETFRPATMIIALIIIFILILGRSLKGLAIARNLIGENAFHFFVYICTLEIAPVCILVKVVVDG